MPYHSIAAFFMPPEKLIKEIIMLSYSSEVPTMVSGEALEVDRLVLITASTAKYTDAGENPIGITLSAVAITKSVAVRPLLGDVVKVTGSKAITAGTAIYCAADGKVSDSAVGVQIGVMKEAISADGGKAAAWVWGTRSANDTLRPRAAAVEYFDEFWSYDNTATVGDYAETTDGGTIDVIDAANGVLSIATTGTIEDESYVSSLHEIFKFQTDKNLHFEARVQLTEANTDDANIVVGLSDTVAANFLQEAGAGPAASYDGAVFFKVLNGTVWQFETSNAATQVTDTDVGAFSDGEWQKLEFDYDYNDGVTANVTCAVDGVADAVAKTLTIAGLEEMHAVFGVKAGGANAETLLIDYVQVTTER